MTPDGVLNRCDEVFRCYRVWFKDRSATLIDATSAQEAKVEAIARARRNADCDKVVAVECLDKD